MESSAAPRYWLIVGFSFTLVGAVLAFALKDSDASVLGVSLQPLGGVLFAAGALLLGASALSSMGSGGALDGDGIRSIGGLVAVVAGITAVTSLAIVTLTQLGSDNKDSIVAVTSSAFGVISAVVGAYLGIKITADTSRKASEDAQAAAVSKHVAAVTKSELAAVSDTAKGFASPTEEKELDAARIEARERGKKTADPPQGGGEK